jgi:hypothetical protein
MTAAHAAAIHYRVSRQASGLRPGAHKSRSAGPGLETDRLAPLQAWPDARRIDVHATLRDPFGRWFVRVPRSRTAVRVEMLVDVSASMAFGTAPRKQDVAADLVAALGETAWRTGDDFGVTAFDTGLVPEWGLSAGRRRGAAVDWARRLRGATLAGRGSGGLEAAARTMAGRRGALVFIVSDFLMPPERLSAGLDALGRHAVVPVRIGTAGQFDRWPERGLAEVEDPETGEQRLVWFRPALAQRMREAGRSHAAAVRAICVAHGRAPLELPAGFDADRINGWFMGDDEDPHAAVA